ncbi:ABC transporter ATP-binding protein [Oceanobacillus halophilus]|uniref:ABC transporter ATP-binding protein n=1 Tax=Oceanobacillus halophilus TaxID=930130 RepID=A0A494ZT26_9BACI|nr:ABC transporter ATP-binding protein [Oceanobacillus halophilus]RKQ28671.1 ABC transporter ATP-binding protein [Oceanobacillus halophilus]
MPQPLLKVEHLKKTFPVESSGWFKKNEVKAVHDVSFDIYEGETFGIVGESGCGKSTTGRTLLRLTEPSGGKVIYQDQDIFSLKEKNFRPIREDLQMIFQDPLASLDPKKRIGYSLEEPFIIQKKGTKKERKEMVLKMLERVGFSEEHYHRFPHEFSGGQRQRIGIARALVLNPKFIVCDEPVSALDVSIQSQILNLLKELQQDFGLSYLFIGHDLSVVRYIANRIGVMYLGEMVEQAPTEELFENPLHPYTKSLLSAVPVPNPKVKRERIVLKGEVPSPLDMPKGCVFHTRCPLAMDICKEIKPPTYKVKENHRVQCHLYEHSEVSEADGA